MNERTFIVSETQANDYSYFDDRIKSDWGQLNAAKPQNWPFFVISNQKRAIGFVFYWLNLENHEAQIVHIHVEKKERGFGLGKSLLKSSMESLNQKGVLNYFLEVETSNQVALSLYQKLGFIILTRKKDFYGKDRDAWFMKLEISEKD